MVNNVKDERRKRARERFSILIKKMPIIKILYSYSMSYTLKSQISKQNFKERLKMYFSKYYSSEALFNNAPSATFKVSIVFLILPPCAPR